jgi:hypothetical protein
MYGKDPALPLRAMGYFKDGDLPLLGKVDQDILRAARDRVSNIRDFLITERPLNKKTGVCKAAHLGTL